MYKSLRVALLVAGALVFAGQRWPAAEHIAGWFDYKGYDATGVPGRTYNFGKKP